jgi:hypothetical protein
LCSHTIIYMGFTYRFALIGQKKIQKSEKAWFWDRLIYGSGLV